MSNEKIETIEKKLKRLQLQKNKLLRAEKDRLRKQETKIKIIVGGYYLRKLKAMPPQEALAHVNKIEQTIDAKRPSDLAAITALKESLQETTQEEN